MRWLLLAFAILLSTLLLTRIPPLNSGVALAGNELKVPYSWDLTGPKSVLAVVTPTEPKWLRVTSFNVYRDGKWVRSGSQTLGRYVGGKTYTVAVTPYAIMLYPAFPVPQPYPGTAPRVEGGTEIGDTYTYNGFRTNVIAKYSPPFPYAQYPQLSIPLRDVLGSKEKWSTPRVQALASKILNMFRDRTLGDLLSYLTEWLRTNYKYSLKYSGTPAGDPVDWFLFVSKTGMCVHFASAAAVLLNDMGVKARVVYGFANSYLNNDLRVFVTPTHVWVEVWTPQGWVPWDPSPPMAVSLGSNVAPVVTQSKAQGPVKPQLNKPASPKGSSGASWTFKLNLYMLILFVSMSVFVLKGAVPWIKGWPIAFRSCVERLFNVRGLTLKEVAKLTGLRELEEVQVKYLKEGKWGYRGLLKALLWCVREKTCILFKRRSSLCSRSQRS